MRYTEMDRAALAAEHIRVLAEFNVYKANKRPVNMARGKPSPQQVALSHAMLSILQPEDCFAGDGTEILNYGGNDGLPEMKELFAQILDVTPEKIIVGGNSSLNLMFDCIATFLLPDASGKRRWENIKFLCPAPGYDRHFAICEYTGIEMIPVPMTPSGPDMDMIERLAAQDAAVAGMWCVPVFSNPQGYVYSGETIRRLAAMPAANPDFKLFWDDAYTVHHFRGERPRPISILNECTDAGHEDRPIIFTSFSKISIPGAGVAALTASESNLAFLRKRIGVQTVGPDKVNQLRHVRFFKDLDGVLRHMEKHAALLRPKFELAEEMLHTRLSPTGAARWFIPDGGYFFAVDTLENCAKKTEALCKEAGVVITDAGAAYPYSNDPHDRNLRIALSYLSMDEAEHALHVLCAAINLSALMKLLGD